MSPSAMPMPEDRQMSPAVGAAYRGAASYRVRRATSAPRRRDNIGGRWRRVGRARPDLFHGEQHRERAKARRKRRSNGIVRPVARLRTDRANSLRACAPGRTGRAGGRHNGRSARVGNFWPGSHSAAKQRRPTQSPSKFHSLLANENVQSGPPFRRSCQPTRRTKRSMWPSPSMSIG